MCFSGLRKPLAEKRQDQQPPRPHPHQSLGGQASPNQCGGNKVEKGNRELLWGSFLIRRNPQTFPSYLGAERQAVWCGEGRSCSEELSKWRLAAGSSGPWWGQGGNRAMVADGE